ncbi:MAG: Lsr2 family protein [Micrococcales bacterium]|nr:Lsr2 family protein [Micrococcales bacterium]
MAQRVQVLLVDDLDGSTATETVSFGLDGVNYEIDLAEQNAAKFRAALAPWTGAGRKFSGRAAGKTGRSPNRSAARKPVDAEVSRMRAWARANGYPVSDRGRIQADIQAAYRQAGY